VKTTANNNKQTTEKTLYKALEDYNNNFLSLTKGKDLEKLLPTIIEFKDKFRAFMLAVDTIQDNLRAIQTTIRKYDTSVDSFFALDTAIDNNVHEKLYALNMSIANCLGGYQAVLIFLKSLVTDDNKRFEGVNLHVIRHPRVIQDKHDEIRKHYHDNIRFLSSLNEHNAVLEFIEWLIGAKDEFNVDEYS
jgi:hypothetical protein